MTISEWTIFCLRQFTYSDYITKNLQSPFKKKRVETWCWNIGPAQHCIQEKGGDHFRPSLIIIWRLRGTCVAIRSVFWGRLQWFQKSCLEILGRSREDLPSYPWHPHEHVCINDPSILFLARLVTRQQLAAATCSEPATFLSRSSRVTTRPQPRPWSYR
jgi:hypothetical protein